MNNANYRIYDEKLDLLYEVSVKKDQTSYDRKLTQLLNKSKLFLHVDDLSCYRIVPVIR